MEAFLDNAEPHTKLALHCHLELISRWGRATARLHRQKKECSAKVELEAALQHQTSLAGAKYLGHDFGPATHVQMQQEVLQRIKEAERNYRKVCARLDPQIKSLDRKRARATAKAVRCCVELANGYAVRHAWGSSSFAKISAQQSALLWARNAKELGERLQKLDSTKSIDVEAMFSDDVRTLLG